MNIIQQVVAVLLIKATVLKKKQNIAPTGNEFRKMFFQLCSFLGENGVVLVGIPFL